MGAAGSPIAPKRGILDRARRPNRDHMAALRTRMPFWWVVGILLLFASWQILLNPFGFSSLVQRYTQDISNLLITGPYLYGSTGHDVVSVAEIDDGTVTTTQMSWPWTYSMHARVLDAIRLYKPRAVVVDFLFVDSRKGGLRKDDTLNELIDEIHRYQHDKIPIYFETGEDEQILKPIADTGVPIVDPSIILNQGIARQYPVTGRCLNHEKDPGKCLSLALSIYADNAKTWGFPPLNANETPGSLMELVWGTSTDIFNRKWMQPTDADGKSYTCDQDVGLFGRIYLAFFDPAAVRVRCPYQGVIPVEALLSGQPDPDVTKLASHRIVFYGASIEGAQDKSFTPVNANLLADVFVHAMALDNLITLNGTPQQNVIRLLDKTYSGDPVQIVAIIPVILILSWLHMQRRRRKRVRLHDREHSVTMDYMLEKGAEVAWHWFAFLLALGAGLGLTLAAGLSVANWIEVVFVSVELAALLLVGLPDALWGYAHHVAGGVPDLQAS